MQEITGKNRVTNAFLLNFITVKSREIFSKKKEIVETFNNHFVNIGLNRATFPKLYSLRRSLPQYNQSYGPRTRRWICEP